ncbi:MAG: substrate-binding domain-containing protein [Candidatus Bathyarchaeota archaeon]|nr:substrate-binding domain-containing protein [Candidatus Bathyarchaeota archaeon]MDH5494567.1 substrate-binding domain-containing protein [Candidatus Bathyarchaeota archaeon]
MNLGTWGTVIIVAAIASVASVGSTTLYYNMTTRQTLVVATTTSLFDTGLLDEVEIQFEAKHNIDVYFVSVGTGIAIQFAQRGDADMILVHSPSSELTFLEGGYGVNRKIIAYNFFEIVGPETDPAGISSLLPIEAFSKIVSAGRNSAALWISRGDNSGTHSKEKALWTEAGFNWTEIRDETSWFIETGSGMGNTLKTANQMYAYTFADIGTFLAYSNADPNLVPNLTELVIQGQQLLNVYSAIVVKQTFHSQANFEGAITFLKYLTSEEGQQLIEEYGINKYRQSLFHPAVNLLKNNTDPTIVQMIKDYAFFDDSECPPKYRNGHLELYS